MSLRVEPTSFDDVEKASIGELRALQLARLKETLTRTYEGVPHYRRKFDDAGIHPSDLKSLADLARLPLTTKEDLRQNYPFGMFTVPMEKVVRVHASSGTTGQPTVVGYTQRDIDTWARSQGKARRVIDKRPEG